MLDPIGSRLLAALASEAATRLGPEHPCVAALQLAAAADDPALVIAAQEELARLEPARVVELMAGAHRAMRQDPAAILAQWPPPQAGRPH